MVKILIDNLYSKIIGYLPDEVQVQLDNVLSYKDKNAKYMKAVKMRRWDGVYRLYRRNSGQSFYSGLLSLVEEVLKLNNIAFIRQDARIRPAMNMPDLKFTPPPFFEVRDYQEFTIDRSIKATRGVLKVATGGGKTMIVTELISRLKTAPFMFYVLTEDLMHQAHEVLSTTLNEKIGLIGGGEFDLQKINVCTIQTAVRSINMGNKTFSIDDYKFDEDDMAWDEDQLVGVEKLEQLKRLIEATKGLYFDECVTGDTIIITENGKTRIDDAIKNNCRFVQTHDGNNIVFKKILRRWDKGTQKTIKIELKNGDYIKCTKNHLLYTERGWVEAGKLTIKDKLFVSADVGQKSPITTNIAKENLFLDIKLKDEHKRTGELFIKGILKNCQDVSAAVENKFSQDIKPLKRLSLDREVKAGMQNTCLATTNSPVGENIILNQVEKKRRLLLEHVLETPLFYWRTNAQKTIDLQQTMEEAKTYGCSIRQNSCRDTELPSKENQIPALAKSGLACIQNACLPLRLSQNSFMSGKKKYHHGKFSTSLETLGSHGGFAMTEALLKTMEEVDTSCSIPKVGTKSITKLSQNGLKKKAMNARSALQNNITICSSLENHHLLCQKESQNLFPNACGINWCQIKSITDDKTQQVYDIEVEDTHCFFANGILAHNCHHTAARTVKEVLSASPSAFWRFGGSATPFREDNAEIMIQAMFGKKIVDISASYLIKNGFLLPPYILFDPIEHKDCKFNAYGSVYKNCISQNDEFNVHVADIANHLISEGLSVLVLVQHYAQGNFLKKLIPNTEFLTGKIKDKDKRKATIQDLKNGTKKCLLATSLADEGLDCPCLDAVLIAGGGASATRVHQRIGRALRVNRSDPHPRDRAIIVYFKHKGAKHLDKHANKAKKIMKTEPEFHIVDSAGQQFVCNEIDEIMGFKPDPNNISNI